MSNQIISAKQNDRYIKKMPLIAMLCIISLVSSFLLYGLISHYAQSMESTGFSASRIIQTNLNISQNYSGQCDQLMPFPQNPWPVSDSLINMNLVLIYLVGFILVMSFGLILMIVIPIKSYLIIFIAIVFLPVLVINITPSHPDYKSLNSQYWKQYKQQVSSDYYQCANKIYSEKYLGMRNPGAIN